MKTDAINSLSEPRRPKSCVVIDIESAVLNDTAHKRYQLMERWTPCNATSPVAADTRAVKTPRARLVGRSKPSSP